MARPIALIVDDEEDLLTLMRLTLLRMGVDTETAATLKDAERWLKQFGNPYRAVLIDRDGRAGIDYGVYGVPETFVIDKAGTVRYKKIGPLTPEVIDKKILPLLKELNG